MNGHKTVYIKGIVQQWIRLSKSLVVTWSCSELIPGNSTDNPGLVDRWFQHELFQIAWYYQRDI